MKLRTRQRDTYMLPDNNQTRFVLMVVWLGSCKVDASLPRHFVSSLGLHVSWLWVLRHFCVRVWRSRCDSWEFIYCPCWLSDLGNIDPSLCTVTFPSTNISSPVFVHALTLMHLLCLFAQPILSPWIETILHTSM